MNLNKSTRFFCKEVYILHTCTFCFQLAKCFWTKTCMLIYKLICTICSILFYYCFKPFFSFLSIFLCRMQAKTWDNHFLPNTTKKLTLETKRFDNMLLKPFSFYTKGTKRKKGMGLPKFAYRYKRSWFLVLCLWIQNNYFFCFFIYGSIH
jgi:hypothetical protein